MSRTEHLARQRSFYSSRDHRHLRPTDDDPYADHICLQATRAADVGPGHRVLELGAGFGRFTFPLLRHCGSVVAVDLSQRTLAELDRKREELEIPPQRCRTVSCDADELTLEETGGRVASIVGFFLLHHLPRFAPTIARLTSLLEPGGSMVFVEPNRRNPLYLAQIMLCADMSWREEKGLYRLSERAMRAAFQAAAMVEIRTQTFGFFPPQVVNRFSSARRLERFLERRRILRPFLPFLLASARLGP
jgi:ubiquinone/menaquinone biosynthesis C-methylase UbiE